MDLSGNEGYSGCGHGTPTSTIKPLPAVASSKKAELEDSAHGRGSSKTSRTVLVVRSPSPVRFVAGTLNYTLLSLQSSGYTAPAILDGLRNLIMIELGGIVKVSTPYMFQHSLPCIPNIKESIDKVLEACIAKDMIVGGRWKAFPIDPKERYKKGGKKNHENAIYKDFGGLWKRIVGICKSELPKQSDGKDPEPIVRFRSVPNITGMSERESKHIKPDAILELVRTTMIRVYAKRERDIRGYCICDAACPVEVKPDITPDKRADNLEKLSYNANRYFADDPQRRAVYGIDIENTEFRVLTYSRTGVIASEQFNWIKDHRDFIRVIISLSFATEEELGYDPHLRRIEADVPEPAPEPERVLESEPEPEQEAEPELPFFEPITPTIPLRRSMRNLKKEEDTIPEEDEPRKRRRIEEEIAYEIDVDDQTYITLGPCLSDYRADFFVGRATRIFLAYLKGDPHKTLYVVKISNLTTTGAEVDRLEGNILFEINKKSEELGCARFFPTLVSHGFPQIERQGMEQKSDSSNLFLQDNVVALGFYPGVVATRIKTKQSSSSKTAGSHGLQSRGEIYSPISPSITGLPSNVLTNVKEFLQTCFPRRYQYRLVIKEVGKPISTLTNLSTVFYVLEQTTYALKWLHIIGYLHRDLSLGNILYMKYLGDDITPENRGIRVILSDYDSSKKIDDLATDGTVRTGTPEFLSNELIQGGYYGGLNRTLPQVSNNPSISASQVKLESSNLKSSTEKNEPHPNYMHNVESLKWIALWFLFNYVPCGYTAATNDQITKQYKTGKALFSLSQSLGSKLQRLTCFTDPSVFETSFKTLPPTFIRLLPYLNHLRDYLLGCYLKTELSESFEGPISYKGVKGDASFYEEVASCFRSCLVEVDSEEWGPSDII